MIRTLKPKRCQACRNEYQPRSSTQQACSPLCAIAIAQAKRHKAEMAETRKKLVAIKPRSQWLKEAQFEFNKFIRLRDAELPCISCGRWHEGQWHAGHYLSTGACPELRFDEANCHKQCQPCNTHLHGNLVNYRRAIVDRIGAHELERLEGPQSAQKYSVAELKLIRDTYRAKTRALLAEQRIAA